MTENQELTEELRQVFKKQQSDVDFIKANSGCKNADVNLFFSESYAQIAQAKRICANCPIIEQCREFGLNHERYGTWGGLSENERAQIRREQGISIVSLFSTASYLTAKRAKTQDIKHGTDAGYKRERKLNLEPCVECTRAHTQKSAEAKARHLARKKSQAAGE